MTHAVYCEDCDEMVWPPADAEGPGGQSEIAALRLALTHARERGHTSIETIAGCYYVGDGERPTSFGDRRVDAEEVAVPDRSQLANVVAGAARRLDDVADSLDDGDDVLPRPHSIRRYADAVRSNIPDGERDVLDS